MLLQWEGVLLKHLRELAVNIGRRPTGSWNNQRAAAYLVDQLTASNLEVAQQPFPCLDWHRGEAVLVAPETKIPLRSADYSGPCDAKGPLVSIGTLTALQESCLRGSIVFLHGSLTAEALSPKNFRFYNPAAHQEILALLEEKQPAGIITPSLQSDQYISVIEDGDFSIPCAVIALDAVPALLHLAGSSVRLFIGSRRRASHGSNVLAKTGRQGPRAILTAHFDTKPDTPGALDNAVGTAALLTLAEYWQERPLTDSVELVFFNGEDYFSNPGETLYFDTVLQRPHDIRWAANVDGIGLRESSQGAAAFGWPAQWKTDLEQAYHQNGIVAMEPWQQGDHMLYVLNDIPTLAFTSVGIFDIVDSVVHTADDTLDLVEPTKVLQVVRCLDELVRKFV